MNRLGATTDPASPSTVFLFDMGVEWGEEEGRGEGGRWDYAKCPIKVKIMEFCCLIQFYCLSLKCRNGRDFASFSNPSSIKFPIMAISVWLFSSHLITVFPLIFLPLTLHSSTSLQCTTLRTLPVRYCIIIDWFFLIIISILSSIVSVTLSIKLEKAVLSFNYFMIMREYWARLGKNIGRITLYWVRLIPYSYCILISGYLLAQYHSGEYDRLFETISRGTFPAKHYKELQDLWYAGRYKEVDQ